MYWKSLRRFLWGDEGPTTVEYAFMLALIVMGCLTAIAAIGTYTNAPFSSTGAKISAANTAGGL